MLETKYFIIAIITGLILGFYILKIINNRNKSNQISNSTTEGLQNPQTILQNNMYESSRKFNGKPVKDVSDSPKVDLSNISPLVRIEPQEDQSFPKMFGKFLSTQDTSSMDSLVIGYWSSDYDLSDTTEMKQMAEAIFANKDKLGALKALFIGAIEQEESEISWTELMDLSPFINNGALSLEYFRARGAGDFFSQKLASKTLKKLALETGGLNKQSVSQILQSDLPNLEYLEIWIGDDEYGNTSLQDIKPLFDTKQFPKLRYLGLRNCEFADQLATKIANAPILGQLEELDLSLGTLGDIGATALLSSVSIAKLKRLNLDYHFIGDEVLMALKSALPNVSANDRQKEDEYDGGKYRYIFVSE